MARFRVPSYERGGGRGRERGRPTSSPAPIGGWNAKDPIANMAETDALRLDNWFPEERQVRVRSGFAKHTELNDFTGDVESLMAWRGPSTEKLFAAAGGSIYNVTTGGSVTQDVTSLTSDRWQHVMFANSAGHFLYIVNGQDAPRYYNGTSWSTPTITGSGLTASNLINVNVYKRALYFIEKNSMRFWYFPVDTISGAITSFDIGPLCRDGGHLVAMGTWTIDGGDGIDDYAVFITSQGEVVIYQGTDPSNAAKWAHVGTYKLGAPIGNRCMMKLGSDLVIITKDGFIGLGNALPSARISDRAAYSDKISGILRETINAKHLNFGWQGIVYPESNMVVFNIPVSELVTSYQYVANTNTGAWCRFIGINAFCWETYNDGLYFGGSDYVYQAETGLNDDDQDITTDAETAFFYFSKRGILKKPHMVQPVLSVDGTIDVSMIVNTDFAENIPDAAPSFTSTVGASWDDAEWDAASWAAGVEVNKAWQSVNGLGDCASVRMRTSSNNGSISWQALQWITEDGTFF